MARLAIFIDGGYLDKMGVMAQVRVDLLKLAEAVRTTVARSTPEPLDLLRAYYYHSLPYQGDPPTPEESRRYAEGRRFFSVIQRLPRFEVREGRLAFRGVTADGKPILQQKRVDLLLGLDFALLSGKRTISHAAVVSGDSDLIPAFQVAKQEGIAVWLFHGPRRTYAEELWEAADERMEMTPQFLGNVARTAQQRPPGARV